MLASKASAPLALEELGHMEVRSVDLLVHERLGHRLVLLLLHLKLLHGLVVAQVVLWVRAENMRTSQLVIYTCRRCFTFPLHPGCEVVLGELVMRHQLKEILRMGADFYLMLLELVLNYIVEVG